MRFAIDNGRVHLDRRSKILRLAVEGLPCRAGEAFFQGLASDVAEAFGMRACLISECLDAPPTRVATLGFWNGMKSLGRYEYDLRGTPCEAVLTGRERIHRHGARQLFPEDADLAELMAESYAAVPMRSADGTTIGHLALFDDRPLEDDADELELLRIFAQLAASELERRRAVARLRDLERRQEDGFQLASAQLEQLESQLLKMRRATVMGRMASRMAHDFNNLLTGILGYGDMLLWQLPPDTPTRRACEEIVGAAQRGAALTQQIMAFSRPPASQLHSVDLNRLLGGLEPLLRRFLGKGVELDLELDDDLFTVIADPSLLELIVMDLVANAQDAMPEGGRLKVSTVNLPSMPEEERPHPELAPGDHVCLAVSDSGDGMGTAVRRRIFEPFFTTKEDATGLGLSAVRNIVQLSGGVIAVDTEPSIGTRFTIFLPRAAEPDSAATGCDSEGVTSGKKRVLGKRKACETVLIAEDQHLVRHLVRRVLEARGYRILDASDAREALDVAAHHQGTIDLLISDVVMPGESGRILADKLQRLRPGLKVIFMSGHTAEHLLRHGVRDDSPCFLQKPFTEKSLVGKVEEILTVAEP